MSDRRQTHYDKCHPERTAFEKKDTNIHHPTPLYISESCSFAPAWMSVGDARRRVGYALYKVVQNKVVFRIS